MLLIALSLSLAGCFTSHHLDATTGDRLDTVSGPYGTTAYMDAGGRNELLRDAADGDVPVTVTTRTQSGNRATSETITVGAPQYGYGVIPTYVSYDPNLAQAAAYSAAYRKAWGEQNGMALPAVGGGSNGNGASAPAGQPAVDLKATCPKTLAEIRTQAQVDACQNADIGNLAAHMPVSK